MPKARSVMAICPRTGVSRPECSCPGCVAEQIRQFRPMLLEADPIGEIRVARTTAPGGPAAGRGE